MNGRSTPDGTLVLALFGPVPTITDNTIQVIPMTTTDFTERHPITYDVDTTSDLADAVTNIKQRFTAKRGGEVLCKVGDDWLQDPRREPICVIDESKSEPDDPARVSAAANAKNRKYYTVIQFEEPLNPLVESIQQSDMIEDVAGTIELGADRQRLSANLEFEGAGLVDPTGNKINLGIRLDTGHTGFAAVRLDVGAERLVCSNGMTAWDSELSFTHQHNDGPFRPALVFDAIDAIGADGAAQTQHRFEQAHQEHLDSKDQMFLLLLDAGIEWLFDDPYGALQDAFEAELQWHDDPGVMETNPTLYDAYCVGTYAIDHLATDDMKNPQRAKNAARRGLTMLLEHPVEKRVPDAPELVATTVTNRQDEVSNGGDFVVPEEQDLLEAAASQI